MTTYKVTSNRIAGKQPGDSISDEELAGVNVDALIEAGHISKTEPRKPKQSEEQ